MRHLLKRITTRDDRGASAVEYGLLIVGIAAVVVVAVYALGIVTGGAFTDTCDRLDAATSASASC
jgi:pilus assembly protein Flp/PilA